MLARSRTKSDAILPVPAMPQRTVMHRFNTPRRHGSNTGTVRGGWLETNWKIFGVSFTCTVR
jgi:hypothetical protein